MGIGLLVIAVVGLAIFLFKVLISYAASQAIFSVAVFLFELYESLAVAGSFYKHAALLPHSCYIVVFGFYAVEDIECPLAEFFIGGMPSVCKEKRYGGVYYQHTIAMTSSK